MREAVQKKILESMIARCRSDQKQSERTRLVNKKKKERAADDDSDEEDEDEEDMEMYEEQVVSRRFVLIVDSRATRVLSSVLGTNELSECGVAITESLKKARQPFPTLEAIYFMEPTVENCDLVAKDFENFHQPLYFRAHVFLTRKPSKPEDVECIKSLFQRLKGIPEQAKKHTLRRFYLPGRAPPPDHPSRLATLLEVNLDFLAVEEHCFHLDLPRSLLQLFGPDVEQGKLCEARIVDGLASLCATLHEYPYIRYPESNVLCERIARNLGDHFNYFFSVDDSFWYHGDTEHSTQARSTVLVLDRRDDLATPLLHEFTYQSLIYDLLKSRDMLIQYGQSSTEQALISESDSLWQSFRYAHITSVIERIISLAKESAELAVYRYHEQQGSAGEDFSLSELAQVIKELPAFQEFMAKHKMHRLLAQACMDRIAEEQVTVTSSLEQEIATAVDQAGNTVSETKLLSEISKCMKRMEVDPNDKLRVALLHAVVLGQVSQEIVSKFINDSDMNPALAEKALLGLGSLGVRLLSSAYQPQFGNHRSSLSQNRPMSERFAGSTSWFSKSTVSHRSTSDEVPPEAVTPFRDPDTVNRYVKLAKQAKATQGNAPRGTRFIPLFRHPVEQLCTNRMELDRYSFVVPPPPGEGGLPPEENVGGGGGAQARRVLGVDRSLSVRKHGSTVQTVKSTAGGVGSNSSTSRDKLKPKFQGRVIIFIVGGVTYPELRHFQEVMTYSKREVIVGSTHMIKPCSFVKQLQLLGDDAECEEVLNSQLDWEEEANEFYGEKQDQNATLLSHDFLISHVDLEDVAKEEQQAEEEVLRKLEQEADEQFGCIPRWVDRIPFCGPPVARWLNGDDPDQEDGGLFGYGIIPKGCCSCCRSKPSTPNKTPLAEQGQFV